jgi:phosphoenolpyruvate-protein phosphotransferase
MAQLIDDRNVNAETAVARTLDQYESRLLELEDEYIKERASDIGEVRRRLLDALGNLSPSLRCGDRAHCQRGHNRIIVAEELTPTLTLELDTQHTLGFVTEHGGPTSHAAILARALGIPAISGIKGLRERVGCGTELLINGNTGEVVISPSQQTLTGVHCVTTARPRRTKAIQPIEDVQVMANISRAGDVAEAHHEQAEGIGLYRTEFEFLAAGRLLDEDEQLQRYSAVIRAMEGKPVYFRLLDIGGDKDAGFFNLPKEENPYLGFRGSRLLLARNDLLRPQARALARASQKGPVGVMYPMIVELEQFLELRSRFEEATKDIETGALSHGVMFEVPSACLQARELIEAADFASIGSNDLIQYLYAVDRNNDLVAYDHRPDRPAFWKLIGQLAREAAELGKPLSVCGELAGEPRYARKLVELGIQTLSVSARLIPEIRQGLLGAHTRDNGKEA